jgi:deoxyhypusine synthase
VSDKHKSYILLLAVSKLLHVYINLIITPSCNLVSDIFQYNGILSTKFYHAHFKDSHLYKQFRDTISNISFSAHTYCQPFLAIIHESLHDIQDRDSYKHSNVRVFSLDFHCYETFIC